MIYCISGNFHGFNFREVNFKIHIPQVRSTLAIFYTRDAHNGDPCQVVQYYALISGMLTSIANKNGLACMRLGALTAAG